MPTLEQRLQERWKTFEDKWSEKALNPDDKEAVICNAEFRIRRAVKQDEDDRRKKRLPNEDKITSNAIATLRSDFNKMSAKMGNEVVYLKTVTKGVPPARFLVPLGVVVVGGSPYVQDGATSIRSLQSRVGQLEESARHWHHTGGGHTTRVLD